MTEHFTREEAVALARVIAAENGDTLKAVPEESVANLLHGLCNAAVTAIDKKREAQGAVAYLAWKDGKPCYEGGDGVCEDAVWPLDDTDDRTSMPVYTHALPAQLAEQPIKLYADSSNPDMFNRDLLDAAGNRYTIMTPTMCQFDIDASALRAAGLEMKIDGMEPAPDGSSRAKMYWCKVDGQPAEPVNAELVKAPDACVWTPDTDCETDVHYSACGEAWSFTDGGPKENNVRFCQGCGKPVKLAASPKIGGV